MVKSRFCPSPTGLMHIGNVRTALFNVLYALSVSQSAGEGQFLLRIEDTDMERSHDEFTERLMADLKWLGLHWHEGPHYQSQRNEVYDQYYQMLIDNNRAYPCFCSDVELTLSRKTQLASSQAPRYAGTCRNLSPAQIAEKRANGALEALRFRVGDGDIKIEFMDLVQGPKIFSAEDLGDFIIRKADGSSSFMFCNAIDDSLMEVTHALRGEDHLTNTPRQLLILSALGLRAPQYGHLPLIIGFDGKPLSKRNGSLSIEELRAQGYFPQAILNYLSRLGHHYDATQDKNNMNLASLGEHFKAERIGRSPAHFDLTQLEHWQKEAIQGASLEEMWVWMQPVVENMVPEDAAGLFVDCIRANVVRPEDARFWAESVFKGVFSPTEEAVKAIQEAGSDFYHVLFEALQLHGADYKMVLENVKQKTTHRGKSLFMPIRAAISGVTHGPEMEKLFALLGRQRLVARAQFIIENYFKKI